MKRRESGDAPRTKNPNGDHPEHELDATRPSAEALPLGPTSEHDGGRPEDTRKGTDPGEEIEGEDVGR